MRAPVGSTREDQSRNGVRVIVYRTENGSVVDADCQCFGHPGRLHSTDRCPLFVLQRDYPFARVAA
jgi:hypothetical protein